MGVCCSKNDVVKVKEPGGTKSKHHGLLITENVGVAGANNNILPTSAGHETNPHVPLIQEPQGVQTQEAETVNSFNKQDDSAARSTLIFPSYTGYRNQDPFGAVKKNPGKDFAPTALVSPVQNNQLNPFTDSGKVDLLSSRYSPLPSRYSPMLTPNRDRRGPVRVFDRHLANRSGSIESGGFDSDLDSENEDSTPQQEIDVQELPNRVATPPTSSNNDTPTREKDNSPSDLGDLVNEEAAVIAVEKSEIGVGTEVNKQDIAKKTQEMQTTTEAKPSNKKTTSTSVGTDPEAETKTFATTGTEAVEKSSKQKRTTAAAGIQTDTKSYIKMVDASVGTDSDDFYRSKKTKKVQASSKKKTTTSTTSTETDLGHDIINKKSTHDMMVGTDPIPKDSILSKANAGAKAKKKSYVKLVDASVGTDSDEFYRSKKSRKVQVKPKNKTTATLTTGIGTSTDPSPKPKPKLSPRILTETNTPPRKRNVAPSSPFLPPKVIQPEKQEPHPIIETLENAFMRFAKYGDINGDGREMNNKNWAKLCRDCEFVDNRNVLVGDVDVIFSRHKPKGYRLIDFEMFLNCLNEIADKKLSHKFKDEWARKEFIYQRVIGKAPEMIGITAISKTGNVNRMTDHSLYPVSHKMRFDEEGKGLGIEEKFELHDTQMGYVQGYKDRDTYDFKMLGVTREKSGVNLTSSKLSPQLLRRPISSGSSRS